MLVKILHVLMHDEKYVCFVHIFWWVLFFLMCVVVDCDDLAMNGVFPLEGFNRYVAVSVVECLWVTLLEIALETTWDFIWSVFDTCVRLCLRFYLVFVWNHVSNCIYNIYIYMLVTLLGITSVAAGYMIGLFMFCFCLGFCKTLRSNTGKFYLLAMIKLYIICYL